MYSVSLIVMVAVWFTAPLYMPIPEYAMRQIMGIAPTLIIVRLGLGKGVESTIKQLSASRMSEVLTPASRGLSFAQWPDVESHHDSHLIREKPSNDEMNDGPMSVEEVSVSDRVPGSPPVECAELHGLNTYAHSRSGSE
ncbi:hypothetical protein EWM64_g4349 [Hericium alpestre]|uniref:Uncharacterized protein n=1 Tax=Hericium alpestre TaxID=135208 RepID=A0A4Y9ZZS2_9AGAM|nr:hypothetical protein EWM64_g4349 [Hericium alpestre]